MINVVQFSGGKDSTCMLLMMLEKGMRVDKVIFCDTGMEFPQMYEHIKKVDNYIFENYGKKIEVIKEERGFNYWMFDHIKTKGKNKGERGYGWANARIRWCTKYLKTWTCNKYLKNFDHINYIGIAFDEPNRHLKIKPNEIHPLYDWGITEKQALEYCYSKGFDWGGLYENFDRVSCWCCPLKGVKELKILWEKYPDLWKKLKEMDKKSRNQFHPRYSVQDLENKFLTSSK